MLINPCSHFQVSDEFQRDWYYQRCGAPFVPPPGPHPVILKRKSHKEPLVIIVNTRSARIGDRIRWPDGAVDVIAR